MLWVSDHGATNRITNDPRILYDGLAIPPGEKKVLIGNGRAMRVLGVGSLNSIMHFRIDFHVKLSEVYVTEGIVINLFSLHDAQTRQKISLGKDDAHLFDGRLPFPRD